MFANSEMVPVMKHVMRIVLIVMVLLPDMRLAHAESRISYGVGIGPPYNGLGVNVAHVIPQSMTYLAVGCPALGYGSSSGFVGVCGTGVGYLHAVFNDRAKHALGIHLGVSRRKFATEPHGMSYQAGFGYLYFFQNLSTPGWNIGLAVLNDRYLARNHRGLAVDVGYQF